MEISTVIVLAVICIILIIIYKRITSNNNYFKKLGLKYLYPYPIFGTTGAFFLGRYRGNEFFQYIYNAFPNERIFGIFDFKQPVFVVRDPETIKQLTVKDFDHFEDHRAFVDPKTDGLFGNSLFLLKGERWRQMRSTLSPAFTGSKMRQMFDLLSECAIDMTTYFQTEYKDQRINLDVKEMFSRYSTDVIATCAFGLKTNSFRQPDNEFFVTGKKVLNFTRLSSIFKLILKRILPFVMKLFKVSIFDKQITMFFKSLVIDTIDFREKNNIIRNDMINILMQVKKGNLSEEKENTIDGFSTAQEISLIKKSPNVKNQWNDDELASQCFIFFLAGFDTTSTLLSFVAYELAINQTVQQRLYEECLETNEILNGNNMNYDTIQKLPYMDMVISESLRKWPPSMVLDRLCVKDYLYDDGYNKFKIEKGNQLWIPTYGIHHDPKYYPDPEEFIPERFSDDNKKSIITGTYIPFGIGPRNCIGSRFALMEVKAVIYALLLNFHFEPNEFTQIPLKLKKTPTGPIAENGIHIEFKPRSTSFKT